jgi:hypothetical protein
VLSKQEEMREREETMRQDADWQRQLKEAAKAPAPATMHGFAVAEANLDIGRHTAATGKPTVTGSRSTVQYPPLPSSSPWSGAQPQPPIEPPLGVAIDQLTDSEQVLGTPEPTSSLAVQDTGGAEAPCDPHQSDVEHAAPPPSSEDQTND